MIASFDWIAALAESPISLVLIALSIVMLGVALERGLHFFRIHNDSEESLRDVVERVRNGDLKGAIWRCEQTRHPFGVIARRLFDVKDPMGAIADERIQVALSEQKLVLERNLGILGTIAAIAPLIGLLGTVWGIMRAFGDMARVGSAAPSVVAAGVAEALVTTGIGLIVAVPALVLYNHFARRANTLLVEGENHARSLRATLAEFDLSAAPSIEDAPTTASPSATASASVTAAAPSTAGSPARAR